MSFRFISSTMHGILDYAAATALIVLPFLLGLGHHEPIAPWLSAVAGLALIVYSLLTDYRYGALPVLSYRAHLDADRAAGVAMIAVPFVFGFSGLVAKYFAVMGLGVFVVVFLSCRARAGAASAPHSGEAAHD